MKFAIKAFFLNFILIACCLSFTYAQAVIRGQVVDKMNGETLIGASILLKGTTSGTVTDFDGFFELKSKDSYPITLVVSYTGYTPKDITIEEDNQKLKIELEESAINIETVEVKGQRISDKQKSSPLTVESLDVLAIKETAANSFYDGLGTLKGVDLTAASLGFKIINTRGV